MATTLQQVVDLARPTLNDDDKVRWPDAECLAYVQTGLDTVYQIRPDLFIGKFATFDSAALALGDPLPIEDRYRRLLADYVISRAETKDDEAVNNNRAALAYQFFEERLLK